MLLKTISLDNEWKTMVCIGNVCLFWLSYIRTDSLMNRLFKPEPFPWEFGYRPRHVARRAFLSFHAILSGRTCAQSSISLSLSAPADLRAALLYDRIGRKCLEFICGFAYRDTFALIECRLYDASVCLYLFMSGSRQTAIPRTARSPDGEQS